MNALLFVAVPALVVAAGCGIGSWAIVRSGRRSAARRVPVVGRVEHRTTFRRPAQLDVAYPGPRGEVLRRRLTAGFTTAVPGEAITVHVDPANPLDASLGAGGYPVVLAVVLGVWALMCVAFAVRVLTL